MKIYAFIQMFNEKNTGHLERCLNNCKTWADEIIIYDDKSTDDSVEFAKKFTNHIILGEINEWTKETFHKEKMLKYIHSMDKTPDWILWIDCDEILDRYGINNIQNLCAAHKHTDIDAFYFQQINLWRGEKYYRTDGVFYGNSPDCGHGWFVRLWKYSPQLTMQQIIGADQRLYPITLKNIQKCDGIKIIHYGFSDYKKTLKHIGVHNSTKQELINCANGSIYLKLYADGHEWAKNYIVNGKGVPNMFLNESMLTTEEIPDHWFPEENVPKQKYVKPCPFSIENLIVYDDL